MGNRARTRFGGPSPEEADLAEIEAVYRRSVARLPPGKASSGAPA
jgi:hypothetical protein